MDPTKQTLFPSFFPPPKENRWACVRLLWENHENGTNGDPTFTNFTIHNNEKLYKSFWIYCAGFLYLFYRCVIYYSWGRFIWITFRDFIMKKSELSDSIHNTRYKMIRSSDLCAELRLFFKRWIRKWHLKNVIQIEKGRTLDIFLTQPVNIKQNFPYAHEKKNTLNFT